MEKALSDVTVLDLGCRGSITRRFLLDYWDTPETNWSSGARRE